MSHSVQNSAREKVFSFERLADYLRAEIYRRKKMGRGFNLSSLAKKSGVSPSLLSQVLIGKRKLSTSVAESLAENLNLRGREKRYFVLLSRRDSAKTQSEKWEIDHELQSLQGKMGETVLSIRQYRLISEWYYAALYTLVGQGGPDMNIAHFEKRFRGKVTKDQLIQALSDLVEMGLIQKKDQTYVQSSGPVATGHDLQQAAIYRYHRGMLDLAKKSLELPSSERELSGLTISISKDQMQLVKQKIRDFVSGLNEFLSERPEGGNVKSVGVYQLNLQLFPLVEAEDIEK